MNNFPNGTGTLLKYQNSLLFNCARTRYFIIDNIPSKGFSIWKDYIYLLDNQ